MDSNIDQKINQINKNNQKSGILLVFLTAVISGFSIFINKFAISNIEPNLFTFLKGITVTIFLISLFFFTKDFNSVKELTKKQWLKLSLIGLIGGAIPFLLFFKGLTLASAASASFIHKSMFIFIAILAIIFLKEKINKKILIASVLLLLGNFLLLKITNFTFGFGELLILIAVIFWSFENILSKSLLKKVSGNIAASGRMFFGSLFILIYLTFANIIFTAKLSIFSSILALKLNDLIWVLITSLFLFFYVITYYNGLKHINVSLAASILTLGSPITYLLSLTVAPLASLQILGIILICTGIFLIIFSNNQTTLQSSYQVH